MLRPLLTLLFLSFLFSFANGCKSPQAEDIVVTDFGVYTLGSSLKLRVEDDDGLVTYSVSSGNAEPIIEAEPRASAYQKWILLWDGSRLWFSSSDIGGVVWAKNKNGVYLSTSFNEFDERMQDQIPPAISKFEN